MTDEWHDMNQLDLLSDEDIVSTYAQIPHTQSSSPVLVVVLTELGPEN